MTIMVLESIGHVNRPADLSDEIPNCGTLYKFVVYFVKLRYFVAIGSLITLISTMSVSLCFSNLPDFKDPTADFITINTPWSAKDQQFYAMLQATTNFPQSIEPLVNRDLNLTARLSRAARLPSGHRIGKPLELCFDDSNMWRMHANHGRLVVSMENINTFQYINTTTLDFFSTPDAFASLCQLQSRIESLPMYKQECRCIQPTQLDAVASECECCPMWSLPNLVANVLGEGSCTEVNTFELTEIGRTLSSCLPSFLAGQLRRSCWDHCGSDPSLLCPFVQPQECLQSPTIPLLLASVLPDMSVWRSTLLLLPLRFSDPLSFFLELNQAARSGWLTKDLPVSLRVHGADLRAYNPLVSELVTKDMYWLLLAAVILFFSLALGTCSLLLPTLTLLGVAWSVVIAYALYIHLFQLPHFPLLNLMAVILVMCLGADDLLVYSEIFDASRSLYAPRPIRNSFDEQTDVFRNQRSNLIWHANRPQSERIHTSPYQLLIMRTHFAISHAIPSMVLTSLATLVGLLVNFMSSILAVQYFTLFAVLIVLCNILFVLLTTPVFLLVLDPVRTRLHVTTRSVCCHRITNLPHCLSSWIIRCRFICPIILTASISLASYHLFIHKTFHVPVKTEKSFSFFRAHHPFERFKNSLSDQFWAERNSIYYKHLLPVYIVWGLIPEDDRSLWTGRESLVSKWLPETNLDLTSTSARRWLLSFCDVQLKDVPFTAHLAESDYRTNVLSSFKLSDLNPQLNSPVWCPLGRYPHSIHNYLFIQSCRSAERNQCCPNGTRLDFLSASSEQYASCLVEYVNFEKQLFLGQPLSGFRFLQTDGPVSLVLTVLTNLSVHTTPFNELTYHLSTLQNWFRQSLLSAPTGLRQGHLFVPNLHFYEITVNVVEYVHWGLLCSILTACVMVFFSSWNIWLSILAFPHLVGCLMVTVSLLSLYDDWSLGIVEGLVISLSAGLAIDPCLHFSLFISRSQSSKSNGVRKCATLLNLYSPQLIQKSIDMLNVAVMGSSWSTAVTGLSMIACQLLCYHQIGVFLATLMIVSWFFCFILLAGNVAFLWSLRCGRSVL